MFLFEFDGRITYIEGKRNNMADVLSRQVDPLPGIPNKWLPVATYDTIQFIHPDSIVGDACLFLWKADNLNAKDI